jgi:alpha-beta hydrolase superfamily lysophospholipase
MALSVNKFDTEDGETIAYYKHSPEKEIKAVLVITHGMAEHAKRYTHFANFMNEHGFIVYAHDQRGHGETAGKLEKIGFFAEKDGWQKVTNDLAQLVKIAKEENPDKPVFVLGHSMGSFVTRSYLNDHSHEVQGALLSGSAGSAGFLAVSGNILTSIIMLYKRKDAPSPLMNFLSFGSFNKQFKPARTDFDWLCSDEKTVDEYVADPYCGAVFSVGFFKNLINGLEFVNTKKHAENINKDLPMFFFSGDKDPVSKNAKQIPLVVDMYKSAGVNDVEMKIYPGRRHEMLNEVNKGEVYADVLNWMESKLS